MTKAANDNVTRILREIAEGDAESAERLLPLVYDELRALADNFMRHQPAGHTLQPTALVHEAYVRLVGSRGVAWTGRSHFLAVAAKAMRRLLVDHARRRQADKRGGDWRQVTLEEALGPSKTNAVDLVALDDALRRLGQMSERQARIIELRFFGGLTIAETARALGCGTTTVEDDFVMAKAWLARELADEK